MPAQNADNVLHFLTKIPFFSEVSKTSLQRLWEYLEETLYHKGEVIFEKGSLGKTMYVILQGKVKVHENTHTYNYLSQGECFGEYALIDNKERSASVTAIEDVKLLKIDQQQFIDLMKLDSGFAQGILSVMIKRHRELDTIQERLATSKNELELANAKMSGLINGAMDAIIMFNRDYRIMLTNASANLLLENEDVIHRNLLFFFDEKSTQMIESVVNEVNISNNINNYLPDVVKVISSAETETFNEGTISSYGNGDSMFFILILRNIEERLSAENKISVLTTQTQYLEEEIKELTSTYGILAENEEMLSALELVEQVATTSATVLITGETGTGKELIARAIHKSSDRGDRPLIRVNCGAIPANLIESELFGHEKGAFTGATVSRKGRFYLADKGTIFLDEIGELPLDLQPKLLRVIQEGEFDPLGSSKTIKVDVRIIAATHRDLLAYANKGKFREDLYYRLNVFPIHVPPLRDRGNDICLIAQQMINQFSVKLNKKKIQLSESDENRLRLYHWPGNVRELQNLIERAVIVSQNGKIDWDRIIPNDNTNSHNNEITKSIDTEHKVFTSEEIAALEKANIIRALKRTKWKISGENGAAQLLKIPPTTLTSKMKAFGIIRPV